MKRSADNEAEEPTFPGFIPPRQNWSKLPHQFIDAFPQIETLAEMKVILYILRHTWGYQEYDTHKRITLEEFEHGRKGKDGARIDSGVGMTRPSIVDGLKRAIKHGFIEVEKDDRDKARSKRFYALRFQGLNNLTSEELRDLTAEVQEFNSRGKESLPRSEKETIEKNSKKEGARRRKPKADASGEGETRALTTRLHDAYVETVTSVGLLPHSGGADKALSKLASENASPDEVKRAILRAVGDWHPPKSKPYYWHITKLPGAVMSLRGANGNGHPSDTTGATVGGMRVLNRRWHR